MHRDSSITNRQPLQGQCAFVRGSMLATSTWVHGGSLHSVPGREHAFTLPGADDTCHAPGEWGVEAD